MTENPDKPENELSVVVNRVVTTHDEARLLSMCSLLNTFNYAVQVQSKRNTWEPADFRAFSIALCAMDEIGHYTEMKRDFEKIMEEKRK
jgi:hypothetical protein